MSFVMLLYNNIKCIPTMDKSNIIEKLHSYIAKESFSDKSDIQNDTLIFENNLLDSMGFLFLIDYLKEQFFIEIEDDELINDNFKSINSISEFVLKKTNENS